MHARPTIEQLLAIAHELSAQYSTTIAYDEAVLGPAVHDTSQSAAMSLTLPSTTLTGESSTKSREVNDIVMLDVSPSNGQSGVSLSGMIDSPAPARLDTGSTAGGVDSERVEGRSNCAEQTLNQNNNTGRFRGDWPFANSIILMRDGIWFLEACRAIASGDVGRAWEVLKVSLIPSSLQRKQISHAPRDLIHRCTEVAT